MASHDFQDAVHRVRAQLTVPATVERPILIILSGLPGTGKSTLAARLEQALPAVSISSDQVRQVLFPYPAYNFDENRRVHAVARALMRHFLRQGSSVIADATNLAEWHREILQDLATRIKAPTLLVQTTAPRTIIQARLRQRFSHRIRYDFSMADWGVYEQMALTVEPIRGTHLCVDTSKNPDRIVSRIVRAARRAQLGR
ncbi:MAG: AAA family ATPase [Anaerolineae bacterium]